MTGRSALHSSSRSNSIDNIRLIVSTHSVPGNVAARMNRPAITMHSSENSWWPEMWWPK